MEFIKYLNEYFYTKQELLAVSKVSELDFLEYQNKQVMPKCSYKLNLDLKSDSFFGLHSEKQEIEFYAKGYSSWLAVIQSHDSVESVYSVFVKRYKDTITELQKKNHSSTSSKITAEIEQHIKEEWKYFLDGTYGLCTKSGLPEDIAAKELAILEINEITKEKDLSEAQLVKLTKAVNLLDSASSLFAPHERLKSSRQRLVNDVRRQYKLRS